MAGYSKWTLVLGLLLGFVQRVPGQGPGKAPASGNAPGQQMQSVYRGGLVSPPLLKPKFTLTDTSGAAYDLRVKTQGYITLLFFGYTHCPDMCPLQMHVVAHALKTLPPAMADQFKVIFVTTDPDRDTPAVLRAWLDHFDNRFVGLTGSQAAINAAQMAANLPPARKSTVRPDGGYEVGHASVVLAYSKDDLAHVIYPVGVKQEDFAHDLPFLLKETWTSR